MNRFKLTIRQRRFLIIWVAFHTFAYLVNVFDINGKITIDAETRYNSKSLERHTYYDINLLRSMNNSGDFWPITKFYEKAYSEPSFTTREFIPVDDLDVYNHFYGIFASYDVSEYICYMLLGFAIIFIPKLWSK
jgi:hypothetical protein